MNVKSRGGGMPSVLQIVSHVKLAVLGTEIEGACLMHGVSGSQETGHSLEARFDDLEKLTQMERYVKYTLRDLLELPHSCADSSSVAKESEDCEVGNTPLGLGGASFW